MNESTWFIFAFWMIFMVMSWRVKEHQMILFGVSAIVGICFAICMFAETTLGYAADVFGFVIMLFSFYLLYVAIFPETGAKK